MFIFIFVGEYVSVCAGDLRGREREVDLLELLLIKLLL